MIKQVYLTILEDQLDGAQVGKHRTIEEIPYLLECSYGDALDYVLDLPSERIIHIHNSNCSFVLNNRYLGSLESR